MNPVLLKVATYPIIVLSTFLSVNTFLFPSAYKSEPPTPTKIVTQKLPPTQNQKIVTNLPSSSKPTQTKKLPAVSQEIQRLDSPYKKWVDSLDKKAIASDAEECMIEDFTQRIIDTNSSRRPLEGVESRVELMIIQAYADYIEGIIDEMLDEVPQSELDEMTNSPDFVSYTEKIREDIADLVNPSYIVQRVYDEVKDYYAEESAPLMSRLLKYMKW
jgi:hypothetical protein